MVIDATTSYNMIMGRPTLNELGVVVSTPHLYMKYPLDQHKIGTMRSDQQMTKKCYEDSLHVEKGKKRYDEKSRSVNFLDLDP